MAKRKRLSPAVLRDPGPPSPSSAAPSSPAPIRRAPISDVAGEASARAALDEIAAEMEAARSDGRLIQDLPLAAIEAGHLLRDRIAADDDEMAALMASIRARGQQVPVEVTDLGVASGPRYGLISGWRRLTALRQLHAETGAAQFATIRAVLRRPDTASEAYVAMVEENEIRVGLSYYERARVAARAAAAGVFADEAAAIRALFATASRAKRSKILSFVRVYHALDDVLAWPAAVPERLGLKLAQALAEGQGDALRQALTAAAPAEAAAEQAILTRALTKAPAETRPDQAPVAPLELAPGIRLTSGRRGLTLAGPGVDDGFRAALEAWVRAR